MKNNHWISETQVSWKKKESLNFWEWGFVKNNHWISETEVYYFFFLKKKQKTEATENHWFSETEVLWKKIVTEFLRLRFINFFSWRKPPENCWFPNYLQRYRKMQLPSSDGLCRAESVSKSSSFTLSKNERKQMEHTSGPAMFWYLYYVTILSL